MYHFFFCCSISPGSVFKPSSVSDDTTRQTVLLDGAAWPLPLLLRQIMPTLHHGLEKRVKLLTVLPETEIKVHVHILVVVILCLQGRSWRICEGSHQFSLVPLNLHICAALILDKLTYTRKILFFQEDFYLFHVSSSQWLPTKAPPTPCDDHVTLGLLLDTDHAYSIVNMGPPADSPKAAEFRSFWGEKSELRRFQDGSINEAVVWMEGGQGQGAGGGVAGKRMISLRIIQHLLCRCVVHVLYGISGMPCKFLLLWSCMHRWCAVCMPFIG